MKIVATTSLPAVDRPNADRWNAVRSHQKNPMERGCNESNFSIWVRRIYANMLFKYHVIKEGELKSSLFLTVGRGVGGLKRGYIGSRDT